METQYLRKITKKMSTQDTIKYYHDTGLFYMATANKWKNASNILAESKPIIVAGNEYQDIDNKRDWLIAEQMFAQYLYGNAGLE